jgi:hypothetical protein
MPLSDGFCPAFRQRQDSSEKRLGTSFFPSGAKLSMRWIVWWQPNHSIWVSSRSLTWYMLPALLLTDTSILQSTGGNRVWQWEARSFGASLLLALSPIYSPAYSSMPRISASRTHSFSCIYVKTWKLISLTSLPFWFILEIRVGGQS